MDQFGFNAMDQLGVDFINFLRPIRALRPTFEKLFTGVRRALRRAPSFDRAISMIRALRPTFMKSTPGVDFINCFAPCAKLLRSFLQA